MSEIILVTGGARSGKSTLAEQMVAQYKGHICYIATALPFDEGMVDRIAHHRKQRPSNWETIESYHNLGLTIKNRKGKQSAYLLDCVTLLVTNLMFHDMPDFDTLDMKQIDLIEANIMNQIDDIVNSVRHNEDNIVFVTNEVGMGIVPENAIARVYRDIAGRVNQRLGKAADQVYLVVCGQSIKIK